MISAVFELAFADDADLPSADAADHALYRWLLRRLGRPPSWFEVLALRAGLRERAQRLARWAWWRRLRRPEPPGQEDLVADFLLSPEGQILLSFLLGNIAALLVQLALTNPWEGFDGRHPAMEWPTRHDTLRERMTRGCPLPMRAQIAAILAYADWKLSGEPDLPRGSIPEAAEFLAPAHAAAINAMTSTAVIGVCARLRSRQGGQPGRRSMLLELDRVGAEAFRLWPGIQQPVPGAPLGIWPPEQQEPDASLDIKPDPAPPSSLAP